MEDIYRRWRVDVLVLQETKLPNFGLIEAKDLKGRRNWDFLHRDAVNRGVGILVAWNKDFIEVIESRMSNFSISLRCKCITDSFEWIFLRSTNPMQLPSYPCFLKSYLWLDVYGTARGVWGEIST